MIWENHVYDHEPETQTQHLEEVLLAMAEQRASVRRRQSQFEDALFSACAICLPFCKQHHSYTGLMRARRAKWFGDVTVELVEARATAFFKPDLFKLQRDELDEIINAPDATD